MFYKKNWVHIACTIVHSTHTFYPSLKDIMVIHDKNAGIIISGSSLVLQGVSRKMSGLYSCVASNIEGDTQSNTLELKVMCK